ncbi:MAG: hypothetical protein IT562_04905 [Alphaproteobacteria bacterium]|nr:hypothetical protein [Alphaproteobacteria bacterium]
MARIAGRQGPGAARRLCAAALGLAVFSVMGAPGLGAAEELVKPRLLSESASIRPGATAWLAVELTMQPGWHTYWRNPGDAGQPTEIAWTLPAGFSAGEMQWPVPKPFATEMVTSYGYAGKVALLTPVAVPSSAEAGTTATIAAGVTWLVCEKICVPGEAKLDIKLKVAADAPADAANAAVFAQAREALPRPAKDTAAGRATDEAITLDLPAALAEGVGAGDVAFLPFDDALIDHGAEQRLQRSDGRTTLTLRRGAKLGPLTGAIPGLLVVRDKSGAAQQAYDLTVAMTAR